MLITDSQGNLIGSKDPHESYIIKLIDYTKPIKVEKKLAHMLMTYSFKYYDTDDKSYKLIPMRTVIEDGTEEEKDYVYFL